MIIAVITWFLWRSFVKVYSRAQIALRETFTQQPTAHHDHPAATLPSLLRGAILETVTIAAKSPGAGKLIRELQLRTDTGASIVGIERDGGSIVNPGPDEELQAGDQLLLIGSRAQLDGAVAALASLQPQSRR
jgi:CPA2 family monovalent cation:H+ antiporter-2